LEYLNIFLGFGWHLLKEVIHIIVGGDFNLGHMDWETLNVFPGKPNQKQHQQFLNITNSPDHFTVCFQFLGFI
jgi:hypothetical protein